jgi:tetratricopeptide (TPR) repeat protein
LDREIARDTPRQFWYDKDMSKSLACLVFALGAISTVSASGLLRADTAQDLDPSRIRMAEAATSKGDALLKKDKFAQAEKEFRRAIEHEPRYPASHLGLAATLVATSRFEEALEAVLEAKERFIRWKAINDVAGLKNQQHYADRERATQDFARNARQKSVNPAAADQTINQRIQQETNAAGRDRILSDRLNLDEMKGIPAQVFYLEGLALVRLGRGDEGVLALEDCLVLEPDHGLAHYNLSVALFTAGNLRRAKEHFDAAVANGTTPHPRFAADLQAALDSMPKPG